MATTDPLERLAMRSPRPVTTLELKLAVVTALAVAYSVTFLGLAAGAPRGGKSVAPAAAGGVATSPTAGAAPVRGSRPGGAATRSAPRVRTRSS